MLVKFIFNVWEDEIVPTLSELHGSDVGAGNTRRIISVGRR